MQANFDLIPPGASQPLVKPRSIDDVPILSLTFWSRRYDDYQLRRVVAQVHDAVKQVPDVSAATIIGGQRREIRVTLDQGRLAAHSMTPMQVYGAERWAHPTGGCPRGASPPATASPCWRRENSCAPRTTCATL